MWSLVLGKWYEWSGTSPPGSRRVSNACSCQTALFLDGCSWTLIFDVHVCCCGSLISIASARPFSLGFSILTCFSASLVGSLPFWDLVSESTFLASLLHAPQLGEGFSSRCPRLHACSSFSVRQGLVDAQSSSLAAGSARDCHEAVQLVPDWVVRSAALAPPDVLQVQAVVVFLPTPWASSFGNCLRLCRLHLLGR